MSVRTDKRHFPRPIPLWNEAVMALIHLTEVLIIKTNTSPVFYRLVPKPYESFRPWSAFADDLFLSTLRNGQTILEVGSGTGYLLRKVTGKATRCIGLELSKEMLKLAKKKNPQALYVRGDMTNLPFKPASVDCSWSMGSILYVDPERALREIHQALVDRGTFAVLVERYIFPAFFPWFRSTRLREVFAKTGFVITEEVFVGHLYVWLKLRKATRSSLAGVE